MPDWVVPDPAAAVPNAVKRYIRSVAPADQKDPAAIQVPSGEEKAWRAKATADLVVDAGALREMTAQEKADRDAAAQAAADAALKTEEKAKFDEYRHLAMAEVLYEVSKGLFIPQSADEILARLKAKVDAR